jgi:polyisoprenoid-binding protein YceI
MRFANILAALGLLAASSIPAKAEPARYEIDPAHLSVGFLVHHIGYADTLGQFLTAEGSFMFDEEARTVTDIEVSIDAASVFSNNEERDNHVRGGDFLSVAEHPMITFLGTSAEATSDTTGTVTGDLTIRGITQPVTLDVTMNKIGPYPFGDNYVVGVSARTSIKRSEFGMVYAVENGWVGDDVEIILEFEAIRQ